jgi:hypothetical protein
MMVRPYREEKNVSSRLREADGSVLSGVSAKSMARYGTSGENIARA